MTGSLRRRAWVAAGLAVGIVAQGFALHNVTHFALLSALAAAWWLLAGRASGPVPLGRRDPRALAEGVGLSLGLVALFLLGALIVRQIPQLEFLVTAVLEQGNRAGVAVTLALVVLGGIAEEVFFRGAVRAVIPVAPVLWGTVVYTVVMSVSWNVMLAFAAVLLGLLTGWLRERYHGVLVPAVAHVLWTASMFLLLPVVLG